MKEILKCSVTVTVQMKANQQILSFGVVHFSNILYVEMLVDVVANWDSKGFKTESFFIPVWDTTWAEHQHALFICPFPLKTNVVNLDLFYYKHGIVQLRPIYTFFVFFFFVCTPFDPVEASTSVIVLFFAILNFRSYLHAVCSAFTNAAGHTQCSLVWYSKE